MARPRKRELDNTNYYTGRALIHDSELFSDCAWAASVVLDEDQNYTEQEAWELIRAFLNRRVG